MVACIAKIFVVLLFFFSSRRRHTRLQGDWSSDVCSSDLCHLYISMGHNFVGHHGLEPDTHPVSEVAEIECVAGRGIRGDRYFDFKADYKGQITFFSLDVFGELCSAMQLRDSSPAPARRNVITRGVDLNALIGSEFEVQGVRFFGMEECRPCYW